MVFLYSSATTIALSNGVGHVITSTTNTTVQVPSSWKDDAYWVRISKPLAKSVTWSYTGSALAYKWQTEIPSGTNLIVSIQKYGTNLYVIGGGQ